MTQYLYRFRGTVLGAHKELENQSIYCSPLQDLNDPMEGFKDLFWSGDKIVWRNLLRHYLLCLDHACIFFILNGEGTPIGLAPEEDKLAMIRVVQAKCVKESRKEFEFYQAYYDKKAGKIGAAQLSLIKF